MIIDVIDYVMKDYELVCNRALAQFLEVSPMDVVKVRMGINNGEFLLEKIREKTDLTEEDLQNLLAINSNSS